MARFEGAAPSGAPGPRLGGDEAQRRAGRPQRDLYAAVDLGTNNCRLLIAAPAGDGFRVVDGYSQIVRLGEGLSASGRLSEAAIARAMDALAACAERIARRGATRVACVATQACRQAANGPAFLQRVRAELGLAFEIIDPAEEARLAVLGCASLIDPRAAYALVVDIGGGSTELSLVDAAAAARGRPPPIAAWTSAPVGVVHLAERMPEREDLAAWFADMRDAVRDALAPFAEQTAIAAAFEADRGHIVGTSGTVTSLAGVHLNLRRYQRTRVDGLWMTRAACDAAADALKRMTPAQRARHPCIGRDRADLVLPGCAILDAVLSLWPAQRLRVADRGLREGMLMTLMARDHG
ncbi:MAG: Ppx/GppA phosphatase family protein [Hyphomonadaceae bacterium]|nr:Ppx/GppA phosphatase family protein [Hyphomonadaceae bacterium]